MNFENLDIKKPWQKRALLALIAMWAIMAVAGAVADVGGTGAPGRIVLAAAVAGLLATLAGRWWYLRAQVRKGRRYTFGRKGQWDPLESTCRHASLSIL